MTEHDLSGVVLTEAIYIHKILGPGLLESAYEKCLTYRLNKAGLSVEVQKPIPLVFEEVNLECGFRCDLLVENKLIVEVKAVEQLNDVHTAQVITYLKLTDKKLGLLINFNVVRLKYGIKRLINTKNRNDNEVKIEELNNEIQFD